MSNEMELSFSAKIENESFARTCVSSFITALDPTIDELIEIKTIVSEGVSNAIIHGYRSKYDYKVVVKVSIDDYDVRITIIDYGIGIKDIDKARQPMFTSKKEIEHAGMGLTIIETLADSLEIESKENLGTKLIIKKRIKSNNSEK